MAAPSKEMYSYLGAELVGVALPLVLLALHLVEQVVDLLLKCQFFVHRRVRLQSLFSRLMCGGLGRCEGVSGPACVQGLASGGEDVSRQFGCEP